jgi:hypothetical protein
MKRDGFQTKRTRLEQSCKSTSWNHPRGALFVCSCGQLLSDSHKKTEDKIMKTDYKPIKPMKEIPDQLRKLRRQFLRYQQAEIVYSLSHKKLLELASDAGAIYRFDSTVLINREIFDAYLERFHEPTRKITMKEVEDE